MIPAKEASVTLSDYENKEWERLQKHKVAAISKKAGRLLPAPARLRASTAAAGVRRAPGAAVVTDAYISATNELGNIIGAATSHTVRPESVVKQFEDAGYAVKSLGGIHDLDLEVVDSVVRFSRVRYGHSGTAALSGVASAAAITGAEVWLAKGTVAGEGAKKAPQVGIVVTAYVADIAAVLGLAARTVAATSQYYGYDPRRPEEQVFMMSVLGLGMAAGTTAKTAAYAELSKLTQLLFRNATWEKLNETVLTKIVQQFVAKFSLTLSKKKLGQIVPVVGMVLGAGLNFALISRIAADANAAYRERFLLERSGGELSVLIDCIEAPIQPDDAISMMELLQEEDALPSLGAADPVTPEDDC